MLRVPGHEDEIRLFLMSCERVLCFDKCDFRPHLLDWEGGLVVFARLDDEFTTEIHLDIILLCIGKFIDFGNNSVADPEGEVPVFSRSACQSDATRRIEPHRPAHRTCTHNAFDGEVGQYEAHNITRQF